MLKDILLCEEQIGILGKECEELRKEIEGEKSQMGSNALGNQAN